MSFMVHRDHIAITSGDKSTTRCEASVVGCPVTPSIGVTQGDSSDTYRRIGRDSEIVHRESCLQLANVVARGHRHRARAR
jgi:hypothetical protein